MLNYYSERILTDGIKYLNETSLHDTKKNTWGTIFIFVVLRLLINDIRHILNY